MAGLGRLLRNLIAKPVQRSAVPAAITATTAAAVAQQQALVEQRPKDARRRFALALALVADDRQAQALEAYRTALRLQPDYAEAHCNLGLLLQELGLPGAEEALRRACELAPANRQFAANLRLVLGNQAPMWHFSMMNDDARNLAYEAAIRRALQPGDRVLDIGTGSGLLSLMAARAGATQITSCEMVPAIAAKARQIIEHNGYAKQIVVIGKASTALNIPQDLSAAADVLISEIFSSELLGEGVLPSFEHARERLLKPEARIIPAQAWIIGQLAGAAALEPYLRAGTVAGFDLQAFNEFSPTTVFPTEWHIDLETYSEPFEIFDFDFQQQRKFPAQTHRLRIPVTRSGVCYGILQWIRLRLYADIHYENQPGASARSDHAGHWRHALHTFAQPLNLRAGQTLTIEASHNRSNLIFVVE